jgi:hypothetical protein
MQNFFEWFNTNGAQDCHWLLIGKGPSYKKLADLQIPEHTRTIALNHAARENKVDISHLIDLDVLDHCGDAIYENAKFLLLPWHPHVDNKPGQDSLEVLVTQREDLARFDREGRLLWYMSSLRVPENYRGPVVTVRFFSGDAAISLLATAGAKSVYTIGIDGGASYNPTFADLNTTTLLANGRETFNDQSDAIGAVMLKSGIQVCPIDRECPVKVYVGSQPEQMLATKVLEFSIRRHSSMSAEVLPIHEFSRPVPVPRDARNKPRTPFSFQRFLIPELKGFVGKAIYLDSDMLVFRDIKTLWSKDMGDANILAAHEDEGSSRRPQFSVMLLDCKKLQHWRIEDIVAQLDADAFSYEQLMYDMCIAGNIAPDIEREWNSLEHFDPGRTCLLHYTDMNIQPWLSLNNPHGDLWIDELNRALKQEFLTRDYVKQEIFAGNVRPSLYFQVKFRKKSWLRRKPLLKLLDTAFIPPHTRSGIRIKPFKRARSQLIQALVFAVIRLL